MAFNLAELVVKFNLQGADKLKIALDMVHGSLQQIQQGAQAVATVATVAFGRAQVAVAGLVTAGVAMSSTGQLLHQRFEMLARTVAGLFGPGINKVIELTSRLTNWLANLSDAQRQSISHFLQGAAVALVVTRIMPGLFSGIMLVVTGVKALAVAITAGLASTGIGALLPIIGAVVTAIAALFAFLFTGTAGGRKAMASLVGVFQMLWNAVTPVLEAVGDVLNALMNVIAPLFVFMAELVKVMLMVVVPALNFLKKVLEAVASFLSMLGFKMPKLEEGSRAPLAPRMGGFEDPSAAYTRIAQASRSVGMGTKSVDERQLDELTQIKMEQQKTNQQLGRIKPAMSPGK